MSGALTEAALAAGATTFLLEILQEFLFPEGRRGSRFPRPISTLGGLVGLAWMAFRNPANYPGLEAAGGPWLLPVVPGGVLLLAITIRSDIAGPSSRRHLIGSICAGIFLLIGGFTVSRIALPFSGRIELGGTIAAPVTLLWVFLMIGIVEICAGLPLAAGFVSLMVASLVLLPVDAWNSYAGHVISGVIFGVIIGRALAELARGRHRRPERSEILFLGYLVAAATLALFLKSITLAGLIIPFGLVILMIVLLVLQSFERSLLLRAGPRE